MSGALGAWRGGLVREGVGGAAGMSRRARAAEGSSVTAFSDDGRSSGGGAPASAEWEELMELAPPG